MNLDYRAFFQLTYGLYIVTASDGEKGNGCVVNTVCQVTAEPPRIAVCVHKENLTHDYILKSGAFGVSVIDATVPLKFVGIFGFNSGRTLDKLKHVCYKRGSLGCPLVTQNAVACMEARVERAVDLGTHTMFVGEVVTAESITPGRPLTYDYYREHLKGKTPKRAPTYVSEEKKGAGGGERRRGVKKYVCNVCGYVYDPTAGDPDGGVDAGTPFEKLPDDWVCPVCGAAKDQFSPEG